MKKLSNHEKRLITELRTISEKIQRNKNHKLSTEKLESDFGRNIEKLKARGINTDDIRDFVYGTEKNTDCERCPKFSCCADKGTKTSCAEKAKRYNSKKPLIIND